MGVSSQVEDAATGLLLSPGLRPGDGDEAFGSAVVHLLRHPPARARLGRAAARRARERTSPAAGLRLLAAATARTPDSSVPAELPSALDETPSALQRPPGRP